jgi:hypothetical protein
VPRYAATKIPVVQPLSWFSPTYDYNLGHDTHPHVVMRKLIPIRRCQCFDPMAKSVPDNSESLELSSGYLDQYSLPDHLRSRVVQNSTAAQGFGQQHVLRGKNYRIRGHRWKAQNCNGCDFILSAVFTEGHIQDYCNFLIGSRHAASQFFSRRVLSGPLLSFALGKIKR